MDRSEATIQQELFIKDRKMLTLNGIINIEEFGENFLTLNTDRGIVFVEGRDMKIENLSKDSATIFVTGTIDGVYYKTNSDQPKGFFSRLFK